MTILRTRTSAVASVAAVCAAVWFWIGCESFFDPKGPYIERLVVYSVLSTRSDTQYVRVYTTYNPSGFDPAENTSDTFVRNAQVTIAEASLQVQLRDTTIRRVDMSRYGSDILTYVAYPFVVQPGRAYSLSVHSDRGDVTATATVPGKGRVDANNSYVIKNPAKYQEDISASIFMSTVSRGYVVRLYLDFELFDGAAWLRRREEVPSSSATGSDGGIQFAYPRLTRRNTERIIPQDIVFFSLSTYQVFLGRLQNQSGALGLRLLGATFVLTQVENNLYKYYNIVNGFQDEFSIRTDQPDYTDIRGGVGLFGAMTEDSVVVDLR